MKDLLWLLGVGPIAGWLACRVIKGGGLSLNGNIFVGVLGAILGGFLFNFFGISLAGEFIGALIPALIGAIAVLFTIGLIKRH